MKGLSGSQVIALIIVTVVILYGAARVWSNEQARNSPPAACQLLGGHWDIWNGWRC